MQKPKILLLLASLLLVFGALVLNGCKGECRDVTCVNGECVDGACVCEAGWKGESCATEAEPCDDISCQNGGNCVNGNCVCQPGWEGTFCETRSTAKFVGNYTVLPDDCKPWGYPCAITESLAKDDRIFFSNLYDFNLSGTPATIFGDVAFDHVVIPFQQINGVSITGEGDINADGTLLTLSYVISDTAIVEMCAATMTKQ